MHPRHAILLQASTAIAAILLTYLTLMRPGRSAHSTRHNLPRILVPKTRQTFDIAATMGCAGEVPNVHICVFARDAKRLHRLARALGHASYGQKRRRVVVTVLGDSKVVQRLDAELGPGTYSFTTKTLPRIRPENQTMVLVLEDHMEPSPLLGLWFMTQWCALADANGTTTVVGGGGESESDAAGLAMSAETWNSVARAANHNASAAVTTRTMLEHIATLPNASIILPAPGNVFVRQEWQNAAYVERSPKLTRAWDPVKEPSWGAVEIRLA